MWNDQTLTIHAKFQPWLESFVKLLTDQQSSRVLECSTHTTTHTNTTCLCTPAVPDYSENVTLPFRSGYVKGISHIFLASSGQNYWVFFGKGKITVAMDMKQWHNGTRVNGVLKWVYMKFTNRFHVFWIWFSMCNSVILFVISVIHTLTIFC